MGRRLFGMCASSRRYTIVHVCPVVRVEEKVGPPQPRPLPGRYKLPSARKRLTPKALPGAMVCVVSSSGVASGSSSGEKRGEEEAQSAEREWELDFFLLYSKYGV